MAICNIFNNFQKTTGNFLTFSQYTEDITKHTSQYGAYKISPSKFVVMDVNYEAVRNKLNGYGFNQDLNISVPKFFQNYFENGCAYIKQNGNVWNPIHFSNLFWNSLYICKMLNDKTNSKIDDEYTYLNEVRYVGDINIQSHNIFGGEGFSEIYCNIPSDTGVYKYKTTVNDSTNKGVHNINNYLEGYEGNSEYELNYEDESDLRYYNSDSCMLDLSWLDSSKKEYILEDNTYSTHYTFNTIIVLYDIYIMNNNSEFIKYYENIPLGIYFSGYFDGNQLNKITKYISIDDIYGMGSSYGLRICSKFIPSQNGDNGAYILQGDDNNYAEFCKALSMMAENITLMNTISKEAIKYSQDIKDTLAIFKNNQTNVPYIKTIGDKAYWFVNGKLIGGSMEYVDKLFDINYANDDDIKNTLYGYE